MGSPKPDNGLSNRQRYRSPVAVDAPPLTIERSEQDAPSSIPAVTVAPDTVHPAYVGDDTLGKPAGPTKLHIARAQVRALNIPGQLHRISLSDESVCQAFASGPGQLKLIGVGQGVTRLVVWSNNEQRASSVRTYDIYVNDAVEAAGDTVGEKVLLLNRSMATAFPHASVQVRQYRDQLVVVGHCQDNETAKKIVRMVRKTCLIPVQDEIKVRY